MINFMILLIFTPEGSSCKLSENSESLLSWDWPISSVANSIILYKTARFRSSEFKSCCMLVIEAFVGQILCWLGPNYKGGNGGTSPGSGLSKNINKSSRAPSISVVCLCRGHQGGISFRSSC